MLRKPLTFTSPIDPNSFDGATGTQFILPNGLKASALANLGDMTGDGKEELGIATTSATGSATIPVAIICPGRFPVQATIDLNDLTAANCVSFGTFSNPTPSIASAGNLLGAGSPSTAISVPEVTAATGRNKGGKIYILHPATSFPTTITTTHFNNPSFGFTILGSKANEFIGRAMTSLSNFKNSNRSALVFSGIDSIYVVFSSDGNYPTTVDLAAPGGYLYCRIDLSQFDTSGLNFAVNPHFKNTNNNALAVGMPFVNNLAGTSFVFTDDLLKVNTTLTFNNFTGSNSFYNISGADSFVQSGYSLLWRNNVLYIGSPGDSYNGQYRCGTVATIDLTHQDSRFIDVTTQSRIGGETKFYGIGTGLIDIDDFFDTGESSILISASAAPSQSASYLGNYIIQRGGITYLVSSDKLIANQSWVLKGNNAVKIYGSTAYSSTSNSSASLDFDGNKLRDPIVCTAYFGTNTCNMVFATKLRLQKAEMIIQENQEITLTVEEHLNISTPYYPERVQFQIADIQRGLVKFNGQLTANWTAGNMLDRNITVKHDGDNSEYSLALTIVPSHLLATGEPITFNITFINTFPELKNFTIPVNEGQTELLLTPAMLGATDALNPEHDSNTKLMIVSPSQTRLSYLQFYQQQTQEKQIYLLPAKLAPGADSKLGFQVIVNRADYQSQPSPVVINYNYAPQLVNNTMVIGEGQQFPITLSMIDGADKNLADILRFMISTLQKGYFGYCNNMNALAAVVEFFRSEIEAGLICFQALGTSAPSFATAVSDGKITSPTRSANIIYYKAPRPDTTLRIAARFNSTTSLTMNMLAAANTEYYRIHEVRGGDIINPTTKIKFNNFTDSQIASGEVDFAADGSGQAFINLTLVNGPVEYTFIPAIDVNTPPLMDRAAIEYIPGKPTTLSNQAIGAHDDQDMADDLTLEFNCRSGMPRFTQYPDFALTTSVQAELGLIEIAPNGEAAPDCAVRAIDSAGLTSAWMTIATTLSAAASSALADEASTAEKVRNEAMFKGGLAMLSLFGILIYILVRHAFANKKETLLKEAEAEAEKSLGLKKFRPFKHLTFVFYNRVITGRTGQLFDYHNKTLVTRFNNVLQEISANIEQEFLKHEITKQLTIASLDDHQRSFLYDAIIDEIRAIGKEHAIPLLTGEIFCEITPQLMTNSVESNKVKPYINNMERITTAAVDKLLKYIEENQEASQDSTERRASIFLQSRKKRTISLALSSFLHRRTFTTSPQAAQPQSPSGGFLATSLKRKTSLDSPRALPQSSNLGFPIEHPAIAQQSGQALQI